jgi:hypothetical protein
MQCPGQSNSETEAKYWVCQGQGRGMGTKFQFRNEKFWGWKVAMAEQHSKYIFRATALYT